MYAVGKRVIKKVRYKGYKSDLRKDCDEFWSRVVKEHAKLIKVR